MQISVKYSNPEVNVLEIGFYRGEVLLHNVFYDIDGLSEEELTNLKKEAFAKFCSVFPEVPAKDILKGFGAVDPIMYELYKQTYNPRGGGRKAGKKIGRVKPETVVFFRRVTPEVKEYLEKCLEEYIQKNKGDDK